MNKLKLNPSKYTIDNLKNTICVRGNDIDKDIVEIVNCINNNNGKIISIESASVDLESIFYETYWKTLKARCLKFSKDIKLFIQDKKALTISILLPIILISLLDLYLKMTTGIRNMLNQ
ncbi:MAG: hypothetical protein IPH32_00885 [Bacteroidetes bacterium]|nr:hypothetical protein [Bacteroidota bacterium]